MTKLAVQMAAVLAQLPETRQDEIAQFVLDLLANEESDATQLAVTLPPAGQNEEDDLQDILAGRRFSNPQLEALYHELEEREADAAGLPDDPQDPIRQLGQNPTTLGLFDAATNHDYYVNHHG